MTTSNRKELRLKHNKYMKERRKLQNSLSESQDIFDEPNLHEERLEYAKKQCRNLRRALRDHQELYLRWRKIEIHASTP